MCQLSISKDWNGGAGNGLGTLYAFVKDASLNAKGLLYGPGALETWKLLGRSHPILAKAGSELMLIATQINRRQRAMPKLLWGTSFFALPPCTCYNDIC